jgi:hypothetical protein
VFFITQIALLLNNNCSSVDLHVYRSSTFLFILLTSTLFTVVSFDMGSNYAFNSDKECKYSSVLFWISSVHAVYKYKFIIVLRFSSNQVYTRSDYTLY